MTFKTKGAIFKNTAEKLQQRLGDRYDASKKYPEVDGVFGIKEEDRMAFASYIMNAAVNDKGEVPLRVNGYNNTSQGGVKYLGLTIETVSRKLGELEDTGAIQREGKRGIVICDASLLQDISGR